MTRFDMIGRILVLLVLLPAAALGQRRGSFTMSYTEPGSGAIRTVRMWVPEEGTLDSMRPLIIAWHGAAMDGVGMRTMLVPIAQRLGAIIAAPEYGGLEQSSYDIMADSAIAYASTNYTIDPARTISSGFSWGGGIAFRMGLLRPELFAGIVIMSPAVDTMSTTPAMWANLQRIGIGTILGDKDFYYEEVRAAMREIDRRGGRLLFLEKPGVMHTDPYFSTTEFHDDYLRMFDFVTGAASTVRSIAAGTGSLRMTPNPARDLVRFEWNGVSDDAMVIDIVDRLGRRVAREIVPDSKRGHTIDTSSLAEGSYLVIIRAGAASAQRNLLVVR